MQCTISVNLSITNSCPLVSYRFYLPFTLVMFNHKSTIISFFISHSSFTKFCLVNIVITIDPISKFTRSTTNVNSNRFVIIIVNSNIFSSSFSSNFSSNF